MYYFEVAPNRIVRQGISVFTYSSEVNLSKGQIVNIEIGKSTSVGVVIRAVKKPSFTTKLIKNLVLKTPLPEELVDLSLWLSDYYKTPLATVLQTVLPAGLNKKRRLVKEPKINPQRDKTAMTLTKEQATALRTISDMSLGTTLIHGVTGSGKTQIYIEAAKQALAEHKSVLILVPEIALTSQLVDEFSNHFKNIVITHSRQTESARHQVWQKVLESTENIVAIGPRSALFLPLRRLGLVVIDEAHEPSFQQEKSPRYSALRAASVLTNHHKGKLLLGSATPSIADYFMAKKSGRPIITLKSRARDNAKKPQITAVDMTRKEAFKKHRFISSTLIQSIEMALSENNQALIFHNRRGSASTTICENCGWMAMCENCLIPLTLHGDHYHMSCHLCGTQSKIPTSCPDCGEANIIHKGIGTKLIETELQRLFPNKTIARFDGDSSESDTVDKRYDELYSGDIDIIVGTQVIAKGLDLPKLRTVGVIQADSGLSLPDFSSDERVFQLLSQVIGRVGRSHHSTSVVVQSYQPKHPSITYGLSQDYESFYDFELAKRKKGMLPPFVFLLKAVCIYKTEAAAVRNSRMIAKKIKEAISDVQVLGPVPAFYERVGGTYRWQIIIKSKNRNNLLKAVDLLPGTHWQFELDPMSLL